MTRTEKDHFVKWARSLSNAELETQYYELALECLGSEAEEMYERGWDIADCFEREKYERDVIIKADILGQICEERGILLYGQED